MDTTMEAFSARCIIGEGDLDGAEERAGANVEEQIAECAERIVALLAKIRQANIMQLTEHLSDRSTLVYQAIGWLAREGRIRYERHGNQTYVLLRSDGAPAPEEYPGAQHRE